MIWFGYGSARAAVPAMLAAGLVFVWPLPHVIALRNSFLALLFFWLAYDFSKRKDLVIPKAALGYVMAILVALACWLFVVALLIDANPARSLLEIKGQWLPAYLSFFSGLLLVWDLRNRNVEASRLLRLLFWALLALATLQLMVGYLPATFGNTLGGHFVGIFDHKANVTYVNAITASLLLADIIATNQSRRLLGLSRRIWVIAFAIVLLTTYLSGARNGVVVILAMLLMGFFLYVRGLRGSAKQKIWGVTAVLAILFCVALWVMLKSDARWGRFLATVPVAWNIDADISWVNAEVKSLPLASDGLPVEQTAYERISWARYAVRLIAENPFGTGVSRNSFRELVAQKFGDVLAAHSHNGYLDLALSVGLPALVLWIAFLIALFRQGYSACLAGQQAAGLALLFLTAGFAARAFLDSTLRDHILLEFMFFAGVLLAASGRSDEIQIGRNA